MPTGPDLTDMQQSFVGSPLAKKPVEAPAEAPGTLETLGAGFRQSNTLGAAYLYGKYPDPDMPDATPGWDPLDHIQGFEDSKFEAMDFTNPSQLEGWKRRKLVERQDRELLQRSGWGGVGSEVLATVLDPTFLVSAAVPESMLARGVLSTRARVAAAHGIATGSLYELQMQSLQENRTALDGALNVVGGGLLSGVLGNLAARIPGAEMRSIQDAVASEMRAASTVGAASARPSLTIDQLSVARGAGAVSKGLSKVPGVRTDLDILMNVDSVEAREMLADMADIPYATNANAQGLRTPDSAENAVTRHEVAVADFIDESKQLWSDYAARVPKGTVDRLDQTTFYDRIARAARNGDTVGIPEVDQAARSLRSKVFEPLWEDAKNLGLYDDPAKAAQKRAADKAVQKYVRAESKQQYASYSAGKSQEIGVKLKDFGTKLKESFEETFGNIRDRAQLGLNTVDQARVVGVSRAQAASEEAMKRFEQTLAKLEVPKAGAVNASFGLAQNRRAIMEARNELDRALEVVRRARTQSLEKAKTQAERGRAKAMADKQMTQLRAEFNQNTESLKVKLRESVAKAKLASRDIESKLLRQSARKQIQAARKFEKELAKAREAGREARRAAAADAKRIKAEAAAERKAQREIQKGLYDREATALGRPLTRRRFMKEAAKGESKDPHVQAVSKLLRDQQAGKLVDRVTVPRVDPRYINKLMTDKSYFTRMYDRNLIRANRAAWDDILTKWFTRSSDASPEEIAAAVSDATDKIMGQDVGLANFAVRISTPRAGPLNDRTLDIPSNMIEEFLVNDPIKVARAYTRELAPQIELAKRGLDDEGTKQRLQNIADEYGVKIEKARGSIKDPTKLSKKIDELTKERQLAQQTLLRVRDRVLGRAGLIDPNATEKQRAAVMAVRGWRNLVASTRMGGTAITGGQMDTAKTIAQYGFAPTIGKLAKLAVSPEFRAYAKTRGRQAGARIEVALSKRVNAAYEGALTEGWTEKLAHGLYKWSGLNHIVDFNRTLQGVLFEDELLKHARKVAAGQAVSQYKRTRFASMGLGDEEMKAIAGQVERFGGKVDGVNVSGSALWDNKQLADFYDAAILKDSHITIQQPGAADRVWWMDKETGKFIGQLKTFSLSAPARLLTGGLQMAGQGAHYEAMRFFGFMLAGGYLAYASRQYAAGRKPSTKPQDVLSNALTESGLAGVLPDLMAPPVRLFGKHIGVDAPARYSDSNVFSSYGGPAVGQISDVYSTLPRLADGNFSQQDLHALRRTFVPWQNFWAARRGINALEGEVGEAFNLEGSTQQSFIDRATETAE